MWVKAPHSRCTTKFNRGRVTGVISPQPFLVDGIPRHVKDLCPRFSFTAPEKDSDGTYESDNASESGAENLLFDGESAESDGPPKRKPKQSSPPRPCEGVPVKNDCHQVATFVIRISGGGVTNIMTCCRIPALVKCTSKAA